MIDELRALKEIRERFGEECEGVAIGIGDDTAAVCTNPDNYLLSTTDSQVEGVHFSKKTISARELGRKAVAVSVSDIGAMGGTAKYILATAGFTGNEDENYISSFMDGFKDSETEFSVKLIGGNLTLADKLFVDITVLGEVKKEDVVKREGSYAGDMILVSGTLGDSALGLKVLERNEDFHNGDSYLINRHKCPAPRLTLGRELASRKLASSMIDISDGLVLDLSRISTDFQLGADVNLENVPVSDQYREYVSQFCDDCYELALSGGEDYELLFTSHEKNRAEISALSSQLGIQITEIGTITDQAEINLIDKDGTKKEIEKRGFVHFSA
ncbi:MAG: thiamine-phosphate kinase [Candidatus Dadabacteria bacterium]|nr:thiamine-phosphate kinase [Candidatus Dadabacteria bacterium]NIS09009.1 thiamine-phosphate kinase [Candidatus Dadabacteria bacterium]NIV41052.1 thiamine-phosphate kinase [Candidatus Dadabacteria bacterium]NIX15612.1 thiamine-phosphate kinase [Candidatus Dadabacteria bacterium]NIY22353.1 thiamine-phosphate kinase [Candidatus Dadabacteria bacterium]